MLPKRSWTEMTWPDFRDGEPARWIAVLPVAAVEQHGPHLPLGVDGHIGEAYLARVRALLPDALPVTFLPLQWVGKSDEHLDFPGTLTLSSETVLRAWTELGESVQRAGVRKLVLVSSHGGNNSTLDLVVRDLRVRHGMLAVATSWHRFGYPPRLFTDIERGHGIHAGDIETSIMLAVRGDLVRRDKAENFTSATIAMEKEFAQLRAYRPASFGWMTQDLNPSGAVGNAASATAEKGAAAIEHGARAFVQLLEDMHRFDLSRFQPGPAGA
jgi:creatinine amidohydrolase